MSETGWPQQIGTLAECPKCGGCCYAVLTSSDGWVYMAPHGPGHSCNGPRGDELVDLLLTQHDLRVSFGGAS